jgi:sugar phosphate isomerase/epimerase
MGSDQHAEPEIGLTVGNSIDRLERTAGHFEFIEFGLGEEADVPDRIDDERLHSSCEELDVAIDVHLPFKQEVATPVPELNDAILTYQRRLLSWAGDIGARKAVLHGTVRNPSDTSLRPIFANQLEAIVEAGRDVGVEVVVENVGHQKRGLPLSVLGEIAADVQAPVCFDIGHAYMEDGTDGVERFLREYSDLVSHLHVHDARSRGDTHMPVGAGEIDVPLLSEYLGSFDGTVAIEVFTDDVELLTDTARRVEKVFDVTESR